MTHSIFILVPVLSVAHRDSIYSCSCSICCTQGLYIYSCSCSICCTQGLYIYSIYFCSCSICCTQGLYIYSIYSCSCSICCTQGLYIYSIYSCSCSICCSVTQGLQFMLQVEDEEEWLTADFADDDEDCSGLVFTLIRLLYLYTLPMLYYGGGGGGVQKGQKPYRVNKEG